MKKIIFLATIISSILFSQELSVDKKANYAIGAGSEGVFFRVHNDDGYMEYGGLANVSDSRMKILLHINKATYFAQYKKTSLDFAIKYVYGIDANMHDSYYFNPSSFKRETKLISPAPIRGSFDENRYAELSVGAMFGLGVEAINPNNNGIALDLFVGEKIEYFPNEHSRDSFSLRTMFSIGLLFNY